MRKRVVSGPQTTIRLTGVGGKSSVIVFIITRAEKWSVQ